MINYYIPWFLLKPFISYLYEVNFRQKFLNNVLQFFPTAKITLQNYPPWRPSSYISTALQLLVLDGFFLSVPTFLVTGFITKKKTEKLFIQWLKTTHVLTFTNSFLEFLTQKWMGWSTRFSSTANKSLVQMSNFSALYSNMPCTCTSHTNKQKPLARNHTVHPQPANQPTSQPTLIQVHEDTCRHHTPQCLSQFHLYFS